MTKSEIEKLAAQIVDAVSAHSTDPGNAAQISAVAKILSLALLGQAAGQAPAELSAAASLSRIGEWLRCDDGANGKFVTAYGQSNRFAVRHGDYSGARMVYGATLADALAQLATTLPVQAGRT
jgi:hypothetical protein